MERDKKTEEKKHSGTQEFQKYDKVRLKSECGQNPK